MTIRSTETGVRMQSNIVLQMDAIRFETLAKLTDKLSKSHILDGGVITIRAYSFYFANIEVFECSLSKQVWIDYSVTEPSFYMLVNLNKLTCYLCYLPVGKYRKIAHQGANTIVLINFKPDWFIYRCRKIPEFEILLSSYSKRVDRKVNLRPVKPTKKLIKSLNSSTSNSEGVQYDDYIIINQCIDAYLITFKSRPLMTNYQQDFASKVKEYVLANFTTSNVDCASKLAKMLKMSERTIQRFSKIVFGLPIQQQITKLRLEYASKLLLTTDKPIKEIAILCGYKEPHYFSKAFKKHFGEVPKKLRSNNLSKAVYKKQKRINRRQ